MLSTKSSNHINDKIQRLRELCGWEPLAYGYSEAHKYYYVKWAATEHMPTYTAEFKSLQGLHSYLNKKLGN